MTAEFIIAESTSDEISYPVIKYIEINKIGFGIAFVYTNCSD